MVLQWSTAQAGVKGPFCLGEKYFLQDIVPFFTVFLGPKGVVFLRFCHFLTRGTLFCALPFLLLSCLLVCISFDSDFHVHVLRDG